LIFSPFQAPAFLINNLAEPLPPTKYGNVFVSRKNLAENFSGPRRGILKLNSNVDLPEKRNIVFQNFSKLGGTKQDFLLNIPAIDGYGISTEPHFEALSRSFQFWNTRVSGSDRSDFSSYVNCIVKFLDENLEGRKGILVGESTGAVVALAVAAERPDLVKGLVLVNPGTSFPRTPWRALAPVVTQQDAFFAKTFGAAAFLLTQTDYELFLQVKDQLEHKDKPINERPRAIFDTLFGYLESYRNITSDVTPETIQWRAEQWLLKGSNYVEPLLKDIQVPVLAIAGEKDRLLPSVAEVRRLKKNLPQCSVKIVKGAGHAALFAPARFNITDEILKFVRPPIDPVMDWKFPTESQMKELEESNAFLKKVWSPVFFSTDAAGKTVAGLDGVPNLTDGRPLLFVGNHQLLALDLAPLIIEFMRKKGYIPRGLALPAVFIAEEFEMETATTGPLSQDASFTPRQFMSLRRQYETFGAVAANPRNFYKLLRKGDPVLLFPGGADEALHDPGQEYQLLWPEKAEFVRMAAAFNATIIPYAGVGVADNLKVVLGPKDIKKIPFIGKQLVAPEISRNPGMPMFRQNKTVGFPLVRPDQFASRLYFKFGQPISTADISSEDRESCDGTYKIVQGQVQESIDFLLEARKLDSFSTGPKRLFYELIVGKQAPSIPLNRVGEKRKTRM